MKQNKKFDKQKIYEGIRWAIASLLVAVLVTVYLIPLGKKPVKAEMVFLGDSILASEGSKGYVAERLEEALGLTVVNGCFGGSSAAWTETEYDYLSLYSLSKSIVTGDFSQQKSTHIDTPATQYFDSRVEELAQVDFKQADILLIHYGTNDYHIAREIEGEWEHDPYSFLGALGYAVDVIKARYPDLRMILVTPTYTWYLEQGGTCEDRDFGGGPLEEYVNALIGFAEEKGLEVIDQYHGLFPDTKPESWSRYTTDGVHLNDMGNELVAEQLIDYFLEQRE